MVVALETITNFRARLNAKVLVTVTVPLLRLVSVFLNKSNMYRFSMVDSYLSINELVSQAYHKNQPHKTGCCLNGVTLHLFMFIRP